MKIIVTKKGTGSKVDQDLVQTLKEYDGTVNVSYTHGSDDPVFDPDTGSLSGGHFKIKSLLLAVEKK